MNYDFIRFATLKVYIDCNIHSFPINCFEILSHYNLTTHPYSTLNEELRDYCISYSSDALNYKDKICYNDKQPYGRICFSLMHELGHILLHHSEAITPKIEQEANVFASNILAPRMAIHYARCRNQTEVSKIFNLTNEAAQYAYDDYRRWHRRIVYKKMGSFDRAIYSHFYNEDYQKFIYSIKRCVYCDETIYNSQNHFCKKCSISHDYNFKGQEYDDLLHIAENQWLYGENN